MTRTQRIPLEELVSLPDFHYVTTNWQRDKVAFYWDRTGRIELWLLDLRDGRLTQLSHGEVPRSLRTGFAWSRDGRTIVFGLDQNGDEMHNLYRLDVQTNAVTQLTNTTDTQRHIIEFSPDDAWMSVSAATRGGGQLNLCRLRPDGSDLRWLTSFKRPFYGGRWSPDGDWLAGTSSETEDPKNQDVYLVRADGSEVRRVLSIRDGSKDFAGRWHPGGRQLLVNSDAPGVFRPALLDVQTGDLRWFGREDTEEYPAEFSPDGRLLLAIRNQDSMIVPILYRLDDGSSRILDVPPGIAAGAGFALDGDKVLVTYHTSTRRPELVLYDLQTDRHTVLVPAEYGSISPELFVDHEYLWLRSKDNLEFPALLYQPRDIHDGARLPALVVVHGGPTHQWFRGWDPYAQFLADRGYVVIQPNIRGSTGYGVKFRELNIHDWGGGDLDDVVAATEYLRRLPYVDPTRLGIFGGSYGAYMTYMAVTTRPDLWKAAVGWIGITDLHELYKEDLPHFKDYLRELMGDPVQNHELWRDRSPITHAHGLRAKLLIAHGVNDPRCPISQARAFRRRLVELGKKEGEDFEYVEFGDEGHGTQDIQQKIKLYSLLEDFLSRNL